MRSITWSWFHVMRRSTVFCSIILVNFLHVWGVKRNHTLSCHVFLWSQSNFFLWWQPRHRRDWPRCRRSPRWPWFALVPRKLWHLPCDLTTIALVGPWVFWCQLKMTSCFWLLSCRPLLPGISQLIQPDKPLETPGLSAGATPLVRAHHCKGKRGYWPNAEHWFLNHWMIMNDSHWMILVGMCISVQACNSGQWTGMICFFCLPFLFLAFQGQMGTDLRWSSWEAANWFVKQSLTGLGIAESLPPVRVSGRGRFFFKWQTGRVNMHAFCHASEANGRLVVDVVLPRFHYMFRSAAGALADILLWSEPYHYHID